MTVVRILILIFLVLPLAAQQAVAVMDFEPINLSAGEALALTERFRNEIQALDTASVYIDRGSMQAVLSEQGFQQSGCSTDECAVEMGQMLGAQKIIVGTIGLIGSTYSVNIRSIDVASGKILRTASRDFKGVIDEVLTPGMRQIAQQFLSRKVTTVSRPVVNRSAEEFGDQLDEIVENIQPYWDEIRQRTAAPESLGDYGNTYEQALRHARQDVNNEKWLVGPGCTSTGCGTCSPVIGFPIIPVTLVWAMISDVHMPSYRWRTIADLGEEEKNTYIKAYKAQVRRTRFQRTLYGSTGGFILGVLIYSIRTN